MGSSIDLIDFEVFSVVIDCYYSLLNALRLTKLEAFLLSNC